MEFIIFAFFGVIAAILTYISASAEDPGFVMPSFAGLLFILLGLSLTISGIDITYSGIDISPCCNDSISRTPSSILTSTVNHYDALYINSFGIVFILLGVALMFSGLSNYRVED